MKNINLGRLEKVDLRKVWQKEDQDFTPWLAQEENLALLGEALGIELELEAQEKNVGLFRADILCKDTANGNWVLIEKPNRANRPYTSRATVDLCSRPEGRDNRVDSQEFYR
jgi:hypothetical protein